MRMHGKVTPPAQPLRQTWSRTVMLSAALTGFLYVMPAAAQMEVPQTVLDQAWQIGEQFRDIEEDTTDVQKKKSEAEAAAQAPVKEMQTQLALLRQELNIIRGIYRGDRPAQAAIDGKSTGPSNASRDDVARSATLRADIASLDARIKDGQANFQNIRTQYTNELSRLRQAYTQTDMAWRQLIQPYTYDPEAMTVLNEKVTNAQGKLTSQQQQLERKAKQQAAAAEAQVKREQPARDAIKQAQNYAPSRLLGEFKPSNDYERDILQAALLNTEGNMLTMSPLKNDPLLKARMAEVDTQLGQLNQKHSKTASSKQPFQTQWWTLAKANYPDDPDTLIKPIRKLYEPLYKERKQQQSLLARQETMGTIYSTIQFIVIIGLLIAAVIAYLSYRKYNKGRHARSYAATATKAMAQFGGSMSERTKQIDTAFDKKSKTLTASFNHKVDSNYHIGGDLVRSLAAMQGREREALRAACHLYNIGYIETDKFYWIYLALVYGDGKAQFSGDWFATGYGDDMNQAMKKYLSPLTAESCVNRVLSHLENAAKDRPNDPVIKSLMGRLISGGDGGLSSTEEFRVHQKTDGLGVVLGDAEDTGETLHYYGEGSLITIAPPGSGKTQSHVFPTLLNWDGPAVVLDVKGEIYAGTSKWRSENVGPVYKFSPLDPATSHCYNPLTIVRADPEYLWEDARFLADMMMVPTGAKDPFWENRARDILTAAIAKVCLEEDVNKRPLGDVLDIFHGLGWDSFIRALQSRVDIKSMSRAGNSLGEMDAKTRDGVLQTGLSSLSAWDGDRIARATKRSDWSPLDLRSGKNPTVYICLKPNEVESYISVLRVFIAQHIRLLTTELPPRDAAPILFVLDELPRLRQMPPVEEALEIGRQYGIKLWMFAQSVGQLQNAYPNGDGMIGSCAVRMYMNPSLQDGTAQKLSEDIGMQDSVLDGTRNKIVEPNVLAGAEYKDYVIVMAAGTKPMRLKKHFAWQDETIRNRMGSL